MSRHARIEELSDSDSDPPDFDPSDFDPANQIITPADMPARAAVPQAMFQQQKLHEQMHPEQMLPQQMLQPQIHQETSADTAKYAHYQCIYPVYFDASRTRAEGRRVGKELAVENPLAREIVDAVAGLQLMTVFEPGKMHPKDWSNPGRVRVLLKDEDGEHQGGSRVKNSESYRVG
jgi:signal recognition particle subunit SRP19